MNLKDYGTYTYARPRIPNSNNKRPTAVFAKALTLTELSSYQEYYIVKHGHIIQGSKLEFIGKKFHVNGKNDVWIIEL